MNENIAYLIWFQFFFLAIIAASGNQFSNLFGYGRFLKNIGYLIWFQSFFYSQIWLPLANNFLTLWDMEDFVNRRTNWNDMALLFCKKVLCSTCSLGSTSSLPHSCCTMKENSGNSVWFSFIWTVNRLLLFVWSRIRPLWLSCILETK